MKYKKILEIFLLSSIIIFIGYLFLKSNKTHPNLLVVNVLDKSLYDDCHIKGSINVPFDQVEKFAKSLDKKTEVVFYCSNYMCSASGASARMLQRMGFKNVWAYEAGMAEWFQNNLPIEGKAEESYLKMPMKKPDTKADEGFSPITTQELKEKIKKMLNIPGY